MSDDDAKKKPPAAAQADQQAPGPSKEAAKEDTSKTDAPSLPPVFGPLPFALVMECRNVVLQNAQVMNEMAKAAGASERDRAVFLTTLAGLMLTSTLADLSDQNKANVVRVLEHMVLAGFNIAGARSLDEVAGVIERAVEQAKHLSRMT